MQPAADFWRELFGPNWTAQGVAVVVSSTIALLAVGISSLVASRQGAKTRQHADHLDEKQTKHASVLYKKTDAREREFKGREHWWARFTWALGEFSSDDEHRIEAGSIVLGDLEHPVASLQYLREE
ncbi:hypothetical protein SRABI83_04093 [Arthrobacter sp. Bi83]|uniref:hypothetical protein n=1 Tax=Arthrobacter sp. Bi83 TaxID=2822353 RepID=UPI001D6C052E|nr:hypothetical protein [Arthrobacter sp. Bi83]CAH0287026.1 hypothetical protein SRABI83_04093 [Arthrobacter sp. Bi83]